MRPGGWLWRNLERQRETASRIWRFWGKRSMGNLLVQQLDVMRMEVEKHLEGQREMWKLPIWPMLFST
jgi:hypothetical protein